MLNNKNIIIGVTGGVFVFGPASGEQACGETGPGRMIEPKQILDLIPTMFLIPILAGKKIVITAGPTRENIDPVRYISNYSSGKMGFALAEAALAAGAKAVLISGPTALDCSTKIKRINVESAVDMYQAVMQEVKTSDIFIAAAAVADYCAIKVQPHKIKKCQENFTLELHPTPDILSAVTSLKRKMFVVGFAAETKNLVRNAKEKLKKKKLNMIIANKVGPEIGFINDNNEAIILTKKAKVIKLPLMSKKELATIIIKNISNSGNY